MMNREQAIAYGKHIGVRYHIYNSNGCLVGGTKTLEQEIGRASCRERV